MSVVINTNYAATVASNNLATSNSMLQKSLNRLSSGSKIVNPSDDAGKNRIEYARQYFSVVNLIGQPAAAVVGFKWNIFDES